MFRRWKEEWWTKRESELIAEYATKEAAMKEDLADHLEADRVAFAARLEESESRIESIIQKNIRLKSDEAELNEYQRRVDDKRVELARLNSELLTQIRIAESKNSPSSIWEIAFTAGFSKAWDMMIPLMTDGVQRSKKLIEDTAISETIRRINVTNKTNR